MKGRLLLLCYWTLMFMTVSAQSSNHGATYYCHVKLKQIPVGVGMSFSPNQYCPTQDTLLHADRYFFENGTIRKIKSCKLDFTMSNDKVQHITIHLTGQKHFDAAKKQAIKQFGKAVGVFDLNEEIYTWNAMNGQIPIQVMLHRKNEEWGSELEVSGVGF